MNRILLSILMLTCVQLSMQGQAILDQYVNQAIEQNLTVDQRKALERKQQYALEHAGKLGGPEVNFLTTCLLYTSPSPRDRTRSRMPSSA